MAQVSYGTITITDTNDIESIIIEYARNQSTSSAPDSQTGGWSTTRPAWAQGYYIWQRARIHKSGTDASEDEFGTAVCITGSTGQTGAAGRGLTATETKYTNVASGTTQAQVEALAESAWVNSVPSYNSSKPDYWVRIKNTYDKAPTTEYIYYKDNAVGDALAAAAMANSLAQSANENANGAMGQAASNVNSVTRLWWSQATATPVPSISTIITDGAANRRGAWSNIRPTDDEAYPYYFYCDQTITGGGVASWSTVTLDTSTLSKYEINSLNVRTKNFFKGLDNSYDGWFASGRAENEGLATNNAETYHYNARFAATHIALGYNKTPIIDLDGGSGAINIYRFPTINSNTGLVTTAGALGMKLSATDLIFYKPPVGNNSPVAAATLNANGLNIVDGSIELANGTNDSVKISNSDFTRSINSISRSNLRMAIGSKFGVKNDGTLYASNATISGTITVGSGSTIDSGATIGGTSASTVVTNASTGASAATDLATYKTTVANTYATQEALSDVEDQIPDVSGFASKSVAIAEEQLIYIQATSGTNSVSAYPSSSTTTSSYWVTQTGESVPNGTPPDSAIGQTPRWTTKRPSYQKNYPVIFVAKQKKTVSGAITCTTPIKDDTTTIIDGGHITTGTIDASRLSVYDATINKISASAIDVGSIQIGQNQVTNLTTTLSNKASINAEYSVEIITSNFNPAATTGYLVTLTAKVTRVDGGSTSGLTYQWFGDDNSLGPASTTATSYNVPYNTTYTTFTVEIN